MRTSARALLVLLALSSGAHAKAPPRWQKAPPPPPALRPPPLETVPTFVEVTRIDVLATKDAALVTTDLLLARAGWDGAAFDVHVAYGAPGLPIAFEARVLSLPPASFLAPLDEGGELLSSAHDVSAPSQVAVTLGRRAQAGQTVHVDEAALGRAFVSGDRAFLRLRAVHRFVGTLREARSVLVRLETPALGVLPLSLVTVRGEEASAGLCRGDGSIVPLRIALADGRVSAGDAPAILARRGLGEDLCVGWRQAAATPLSAQPLPAPGRH